MYNKMYDRAHYGVSTVHQIYQQWIWMCNKLIPR